ncbi:MULTISPECIES: CPBP family glutamic-type intramembrane protease [unclassified Mesorhizobium]|uniref:type II CAAX prenyl endopeptidase Rce1 family protein n=1 Tax=unclassified Mesorhizobium TaxID=325217 RepID=UPI000F75693C|nr:MULTISPECIES: CPBP family glutamic-type intramembrane protease [unclassified Mesorhizobium]AZO53855.1 CPBP family intramembrane metalloprotease [Mesorhizobium sp. M8A.F.Ca.ET.057.01.1.1]RWE45928.1 MAG: CPBP family intramembrane metalloprotease [Mesorhizobium sp.]
MALADATIFRSVVPASQTALVAGSSALLRIAIASFAPHAVVDELVFRLVAMSALAWLLTALLGLRPLAFWIAIVITALVIYPAARHAYLAKLTPSLLTMMREIMLHGGAGILWGWLYWRHGLVASMVGHVSAHLALQPMLGLLFG